MAETKPEETATPLEEVVSEPKPDETPTGTKPEVPKGYEGKSPEELVKILQDYETQIGKQSTELGTLREDAERYRQDLEDQRRMAELYRQPQTSYGQDPYGQRIPPAQEIPQPKRQFNYEDPESEVVRIMEERDAKKQQQALKMSAQNAVNEGKYAYQQGRQVAYGQNPELFKGVEREVEQRIYNTYAPFAQMGTPVKEFVGDPKVWEKVAYNVHIDRGDFERIKPSKAPPVKPTRTETPQSARTPLAEVAMTTELDWNDPDTQKVLRDYSKYGINKEEAKKIIEEEQKSPTDMVLNPLRRTR